MKTNSTDTRRVHTRVTYHNGERQEDTVWGDVRTVFITLEPGEYPDLKSFHFNQPRLFRPETVYLEWQRNHYWGLTGSVWTWQSKDAMVGTEWVLVNAKITGPNVLKSGELGKLTETFLVANQGGWGMPSKEATTPPDWFITLLDINNPTLTGSPLDSEQKESVHV